MNPRLSDFKLGLFVLVGLALLIAGLLGFGARKFFEATTPAETYVAGSVAGLSVGAPVTLRGVPIGQVTRINFTWNFYPHDGLDYVLVDFEFRNRLSPVPPGQPLQPAIQAEIKKGLRARVEAQGISGTSILALDYLDPAANPPLPVPWKPRTIYIPSAPSQFTEILASLEKSLRNLAQLDLATLSRSLEGDLSAAESLLNRFKAANFNQVATNANGLITDLRTLEGRLQALTEEVSGTVKQMNLAKASSHADELLLELRTTVRRIEIALANLNAASLNDTLANLRRASENLESASRALNQYPAGFFFGKPPPPAKSVEPPRK